MPGISVVAASLEDADLPGAAFDSVIAATSMHWVDLAVGVPKLHAVLRPEGRLAVWRNIFGDQSVETPFRARVAEIVADRERRNPGPPRPPAQPSMDELAAGGWFEPVRSERWRWSIELDGEQIRRLFLTFSDWTAAEAEAAGAAVDELGGRVTEHYQSMLHLLVRSARQAP